jgi:predicted transposase YdaD
MHRPWDRRMKRLFREAPRDLVQWLLPGSQFISIVSPELDGEALFTDHLFEVMFNGKRILLHIEFQKRRDSKIAKRLWEYNVRATLQYGCPVWSCVIYLKKDSTVAEPFLIWELPNGQLVHRFDFGVIKLWEISTEELKQKGHDGLIPLLVLTKNGARREVVEEAIAHLAPPGEEPKRELLALTYGLASLAFDNDDDQEWLIRRFAMLDDIIRETRAYREMTREGKLEGLREALFTVVQARFPSHQMIHLAQGQAAIIEDPEILQNIILKVSRAQTLEEAQRSLIDWAGP